MSSENRRILHRKGESGLTEAELRGEVISAARAMNAHGLNRGTAGNVSARCRDGFLVTPTGMIYDETQPDDIVFVRMDGSWDGARRPSSEWRFHRDVFEAHEEAGAILHAHSPFATALACLNCEIPPFHYMIARFGGSSIRCAEYATFGTQELSRNAVAALHGRCGCLLANHGMLVFGRDPRHVLDLAIEFETLCEQYWRARQIGAPVLLSDEEMKKVLEKFANYGQQEPDVTDACSERACRTESRWSI
ncbi:MAG TPA: class II aldolase/adducin family protein [Thermoanaerobaculia bacterium]|nr:class II aldolase/adducin family protein [Thermoanaerobaculia bacterium]